MTISSHLSIYQFSKSHVIQYLKTNIQLSYLKVKWKRLKRLKNDHPGAISRALTKCLNKIQIVAEVLITRRQLSLHRIVSKLRVKKKNIYIYETFRAGLSISRSHYTHESESTSTRARNGCSAILKAPRRHVAPGLFFLLERARAPYTLAVPISPNVYVCALYTYPRAHLEAIIRFYVRHETISARGRK